MTYINPDSALTPANIYVEATQSRFSDSYGAGREFLPLK